MAQVLCPVLVGRALEVQALERGLEEASSGRGGCFVLTGEPGIGKSRLIRELVRMADDRDVAVVSGRATPASVTVPYRPLTEALLQLVRRVPIPDDRSLRPWLSHLAVVLPGVVVGAEASHPSGASGSDAVRGEAILQLVRRLSPEGLVVILEDIHWADADTVALVEYLADNATGQPLLFVVSLRTDPPSPAVELVRRQRGRPGVGHLHLDRLRDPEVADMITASRPDADPALRARIVRTSDGVPLLVEELLASPGIPESITDTVRVRLDGFTPEERSVLEAAAVMGRHFDWEILAAASGQERQVVARSLERAVDRLIVSPDGSGFRFRHALTREAVLEIMLPPRVQEVAARALAAIDAAHPYLEGSWKEVVADLAVRAGDAARAGRLLADTGRYSIQVGALSTAVDALLRAVDLLAGEPERVGAQLALVEALSLAGRVDEAAAAARGLIGQLGEDPATAATRIEAHLRLAHAAVAASRWTLAREHLEDAMELTDATTHPSLSARARVLSAEIALAGGDLDEARTVAEAVLDLAGAGADTRCHAHEIVGRTHRLHDLPAAAASFEAALAIAEADNLPVWRMRAVHELGTIEMFRRTEVDRLLEARRLAERMGALSTVAVLDLQLAACFTARWDLDACDAHASSALDMGRRLGLVQVAAKAQALMAGTASMRGDHEATQRWAARALAADPTDPALAGFCRASAGMALFMAGDADAAVGPFAEGTAALCRSPNAEPISIRALWPLIQASRGDRRAPATIEEVRRLGVDAFHLNGGLIGFAQAVLEGRAGRPAGADAIVAVLDRSFVNCEAWADLARFVAAPSALSDGWGEPLPWLEAAARRFTGLGLHRLAERCTELLRGRLPNPWARDGVTDREAEVLRLVIAGLANKEIAASLGVSPRTVEKHVESLLRKTGARSRTEMAVTAGRLGT